MEIRNPTETRVATIQRDANGVIVISMKDCGMVDEFDMMDVNLVIRHFSGNHPALKLVITAADFDMTRKAKEIAEKGDSPEKTKARAIVVSNTLKASIMNFLKAFGGKSYPQQFFRDRDEAYQWLLGFRDDPAGDAAQQSG
jgi:hypothetical protein